MKNIVRSVIVAAMLSALLTVSKLALSFVPNVELVSFLIVIYSLTQGRRVYAIVAVFVATECMIYPFGLWSINYIYIWFILVLAVRLLRRFDSALLFAAVSGAFGLLFGALCSVMYVFIPSFGPSFAFSYFVSGIWFDVAHGVGNFVICLVLYRPIMTMFKKLKKYYA
ncbi:MAG: hypothetical protein PUB08_05725 [Firmicutes bacterium]|nr:hypothetical protein [Bacillota bacterium]